MKLFFILQSGVAQLTAQPISEHVGKMKMPFFELAVKGGIIMIPIAILSIIAIYIFIERLYAIKKVTQIDPNFMNRIRDYIHEGKLDSSIKLCQL